jgi:hypothetical protein
VSRLPDSTAPHANGRQQQPAGLSLQLGPDALRPLISEIVREVMQQLEAARARVPDGRLAWSEEEAARLLGLEPHVLRDERRRGRIAASSIVGRRIRYTREDLVSYLMGRRLSGG